MKILLLVTAAFLYQNAQGEEKVNPKKIVRPRQTQVFSNYETSSTKGNTAIPFLTASPRPFQAEENFFKTIVTNFSDPVPHVQFQENVFRFQRVPQIVKATVTNHRILPTKTFSFKTKTSVEQILEYEWDNFKKIFNKTYATYEEERYRREIFIENKDKVSKFNQEYGTGLHSFVQKLNGFADLLNHEFNQKLNGFNNTNKDTSAPERKSSAFVRSANIALPYSVDWREAGAVTAVKNQGTCGACYAFAAVGALEGQRYRRTGQLVDLSTQNLIDCTVPYTNDGCVGGVIEYAYEYIKDNKGIDTEHFYPFEARDNLECRYRTEGYGAHVTGYVLLDENDEGALESAVATVGPIAVAIDASPNSFQFYSDGIYFEPQCKSSIDDLNHAVLVVGYGTEPSGQPYWLIKNSYGPSWGIGGYMKLAKFSNNLCGIATYASYPLL